MMELPEQGGPPTGETGDQLKLPERACPIERIVDEGCGQACHLRPAGIDRPAGSTDDAQMMIEVELVVDDPLEGADCSTESEGIVDLEPQTLHRSHQVDHRGFDSIDCGYTFQD